VTAKRLARYRKTIGTVAAWLVVGVAYWQGAPEWVLALGPGLSVLAAWGLPNALTQQQLARLRQSANPTRRGL
jgi:hypothetical protein